MNRVLRALAPPLPETPRPVVRVLSRLAHRRSTPWLIFVSVLTLSGGSSARPQETSPPKGENVVIDFPDQIDLQVIVDYVGKTLGIRFVYGEELKGQKVDLRPAPVELPKSQLLNLLASLLRVRELAMVEESPGFYRIVRSDQTTHSVSAILPPSALPQRDSPRIITQVLTVPGGDIKTIPDKLTPFLSSPKAGLVAIPESNRIVVTDYESRIALLAELLTQLESGGREVEVRTVSLRGADPAALAAQISTILGETHRIRQRTGSPPSVRSDVVPQSLVLVGTTDQLQEAEALIQRLTPTQAELATRSFTPRYISLDRAKRLIDHVVLSLSSNLPAPASIYDDTAGGRLFVTAQARTLEAIEKLLQAEDLPRPDTQRPLRVYRPKHRKVGEMLATISQLLGETVEWSTAERIETPKVERTPLPSTSGRSPPTPGTGQSPPVPPSQEPVKSETATPRAQLRVQGKDYVLTADEHTNSILAIGTREFHAQLESLIDDLDRRRPQVLIEMTLVAITMSDALDLGVELESLDLGDGWDYLAFSNFGLSTIDPITGQRTLTPGVGANGILIGPKEVPILLRALATRANARVISTPKLLVSDNARGSLRNVDEAPFTSVNASTTVATTSFAGFESAGTTLSVTPHISQGDYLALEYELTFSNFSGSSSGAAVPPPRSTNSFTSTVEVPDGYTLITGGLVVDNKNDSTSEVPLLGRIPGLGKLFQNNARKNTKTKIFAFIRPAILRDDELEALKLITLKDVELAGLASDGAPGGGPLWMR
jgi:general secretion pathway protein D